MITDKENKMTGQRRNSRQRTLILQAVQRSCSHPSAEEVYREVQRQIPQISLGTVYRNLNLLEESGMIRRIHTGVGSDRFDGITVKHPHFICSCCKRAFDLTYSKETVPEQLAGMFYTDGGEIREIQVQAFGICRDCMESGQNINCL